MGMYIVFPKNSNDRKAILKRKLVSLLWEIKFPRWGLFTRYDFAACDKFTTGLRHELFRVNQTYNSLTTVVYVKKKLS